MSKLTFFFRIITNQQKNNVIELRVFEINCSIEKSKNTFMLIFYFIKFSINITRVKLACRTAACSCKNALWFSFESHRVCMFEAARYSSLHAVDLLQHACRRNHFGCHRYTVADGHALGVRARTPMDWRKVWHWQRAHANLRVWDNHSPAGRTALHPCAHQWYGIGQNVVLIR